MDGSGGADGDGGEGEGFTLLGKWSMQQEVSKRGNFSGFKNR